MVNVIQDGLGRAQGDCMLRANAAEKNTNIQFAHRIASFLEKYIFRLEI